MHQILITGGSGFLGVSLARRLLAHHPNARITLTDLFRHPRLAAIESQVTFIQADLTQPAAARELVTSHTTHVYHFASLVSGGAEKDFAAGLQANVFATIHLLEACRLAASRPVVVFTSSIATFGGRHLPPTVDDFSHQHPQNSYGVAKVLGEQLLNDYSRKGFIDGRGVRLPAIVVRDEPNSAASGYASALIREPLHSRPYACPVSPDTRIPILGVDKSIETLHKLGELPPNPLGDFRTINGPSLSPSAAEIAAAVQALRRPNTAPITFTPDPAIESIVAAWPRYLKSDRAAALGLTPDPSIDTLIADYLQSEFAFRSEPRA